MEAIIETASGRMVDVLNPEPGDFDMQDIATSLGNLCRFNGQVKRFYSVAEHSILMSDNLQGECALYGLLHDAAEAYVSDIVSPLKKTIQGYKDIENKVLRAIVEGAGLTWYEPAAWEIVKEADLAMLAMEKKWVMCSSQEWPMLSGVVPMDEKPRFWGPEISAKVFMAQYQRLTG